MGDGEIADIFDYGIDKAAIKTEDQAPEPGTVGKMASDLRFYKPRPCYGSRRREPFGDRSQQTNPSVGSGPPPSVPESDGMALVAKPVHITGKRDIRSGRHEGVLLLTRVSPCEHRVTPPPSTQSAAAGGAAARVDARRRTPPRASR